MSSCEHGRKIQGVIFLTLAEEGLAPQK